VARNRHGAQKVKAHGFACPECQDRGYTWIGPGGLITPCTKCKNGQRIAEQLDEARTNLQIHRNLSKPGVILTDPVLEKMRG
jgi:hypothetical protein